MSEQKSNSLWYLLILVLAAAGATCSVYLLRLHALISAGLYSGGAFCDVNTSYSCSAVSASTYAELFGISLASYGSAFYFVLGFLAVVSLFNRRIPEAAARNLLLLISIGATIFSIYLFAVSKYILQTFCLVCMLMYAVNLSLLLVAILWGREQGLWQRFKHGCSSGWQVLKWALSVWVLGDRSERRYAGGIIGVVIMILVGNWYLPEVFVLLESQKAQGAIVVKDEALALANETFPLEVVGGGDKRLVVPLELSGGKRDYIRGATRPRVEIVEFSDIQCPFCRKVHQTVKDILKRYPDDIRVVFKNYPLDQNCNDRIRQPYHQCACNCAKTARCAGEQDRFWEMLDGLYQLPVLQGLQNAAEVKVAVSTLVQRLDLDQEAMNECLDSDRHNTKIESDIALGNALKLPGTPSIWINGQFVQNPSAPNLERLVAELLQ